MVADRLSEEGSVLEVGPEVSRRSVHPYTGSGQAAFELELDKLAWLYHNRFCHRPLFASNRIAHEPHFLSRAQ
jgi:hypothetical protein